MTLTTDGTNESLAARLAAMEARVSQLELENGLLTRQSALAESASSRADGETDPTARPLSRRGLLTAAAGAAGGLLVAGVASPAGAANGDALLVGDITNAATAATKLTTTVGGLSVETSESGSPAVVALQGDNTAASGGAYGVVGQSYSNDTTATAGVGGLHLGASGPGKGIYGNSISTSGKGVHGQATSTTGSTKGVHGEVYSPTGRAVEGTSVAATGTTYGVYGTAASTAGRAVYGTASSATGTTYGVYGHAVSATGFALYGQGRMKVTGRSYLGTPATAPADAELSAGSISFYLNPTGNQLKVKVKYASGAVKTGTIALI